MKTQNLNLKGAALLAVLLSISLTLTQCTELTGMEADPESGELKSETSSLSQELSEEEIHGILFMREEANRTFEDINDSYQFEQLD